LKTDLKMDRWGGLSGVDNTVRAKLPAFFSYGR
jgi:hypothetical protein